MQIATILPRKGMVTIWDHLATILILVLLALTFRSLIVLPYRITSGSMMGTLMVNDYYYVSKYAYGYSRYSLPFDLFRFEGRVLASEPTRGDIVVFRLPRDHSTDYIKRVMGLPGDRIQVRGGVVFINGMAVERERVDDFLFTEIPGHEFQARQYRETLPNGRSYLTLDQSPEGPGDFTDVYVVPEGHYFMMGDNRDNSLDSRFLNEVGFVPYENLVGRAEFRFFSTTGQAAIWEFWRWPAEIRWDRLFDPV